MSRNGSRAWPAPAISTMTHRRRATGFRTSTRSCWLRTAPIISWAASSRSPRCCCAPRRTSRMHSPTAAAAGLAERIRFLAATAADLHPAERFDLITTCDCLHDFVAPNATLEKLRTLLDPEGTLFIIEPRAADRLEDNRNPVATMFYGFSLFHCMTQSLARGGPGLGTCMGPKKTGELLHEAGFRDFRMLEIKSMTNLFYAAKP